MEFATNAIVAALLAQASGFVTNLGLPMQAPFEPSKVRDFRIIVTYSGEGPELACYLDYAGGYVFNQSKGAILSFDTKDAYVHIRNPKEIVRLLGEAHYSEAECLARARQAIRSLGYAMLSS